MILQPHRNIVFVKIREKIVNIILLFFLFALNLDVFYVTMWF